MSEAPLLRPVKSDLTPECAAFVNTLRELFVGLGISVRRYAARRHRDPGSISRFLNGSRVPPWEFVEDLLRDLAEIQQNPVKAEVFSHIRDQHRQALRVSNTGLYELQVLTDQLELADREQRQAAVREQALLEALQARQRRIAELEIDRRQLESDWIAERSEKEKINKLHLEKRQDYKSEIDRLRQEIEELRIKLREAEALNESAENRCKELEEQLKELEYDSTESDGELSTGDLEKIKDQVMNVAYETKEAFQALINGKSSREIVAEIARRETYDKRSPRQLYESIATCSDIQTIEEIFSHLTEANQKSAAYTLLRAVLRESAVEVVLSVIGSTDAETLPVRGSHRVQDLLLWFTYDSNPSRIIELLNLLRKMKKDEWSVLLLECVGRGDYGNATQVRDVIARIDAKDAHVLLSTTARVLDSDNLPRFLHVLREASMTKQAEWLITEFAKVRAYKVAALKASLQLLGATEDLRTLERVAAVDN